MEVQKTDLGPDSMPVLDTEKLLSKETPAETPELTQESVTKLFESTKENPAKPPDGDPPAGDDSYKDLSYEWRHLATELKAADATYEVPEEVRTGKKADGTPLSEKERYDMFVEEVQSRTEPEANALTQDDPMILRYRLARLTENFNPIEFMQQEAQTYRVLSMSPAEYMTAAMKQTEQYTEEHIAAYVKGMNPIELEQRVNQMKGNYVNALKERDEQLRVSILGDQTKLFEQQEAKATQLITQYIDQNKSNRKFMGIELSEADHKEYLTELPTLIKRDPNEGLNIFEKFMQSDENFKELMPILWIAMKKKLPGYLSDLKESVKQSLEKKLGEHGDIQFGGGASDGNPIDVNALYKRG